MVLATLNRFSFLAACIACSAISANCQPGAAWAYSGFDASNSRSNSNESVVNTSNVAGLIPQWTFATQDDVSATPSVDAGANAVYFPDWSGHLYKLNMNTGAVIWSHVMTDYGLPSGLISRSTPTLSGNTVVIGASATLGHPNFNSGAYLVALDSTTGNLIWQVELDSTLLAIVTASPMIYNGVVYIGVASAQEKITNPTFRGSLVAVSLSTGQILWQTYMVPTGYTGGPIWSSSPALDVTRNQIYVTTGNNYSVPAAVESCEIAAGGNVAAVFACQGSE